MRGTIWETNVHTFSFIFGNGEKRALWAASDNRTTESQSKAKPKVSRRCSVPRTCTAAAATVVCKSSSDSGLWRCRRREQVCKTRLVSCAKDRRNKRERERRAKKTTKDCSSVFAAEEAGSSFRFSHAKATTAIIAKHTLKRSV